MPTPPMRLTRFGKLALAQALSGEELKFTRVAIGAGSFDYDSESVYDLTELKNFKMWLPLTQIKVVGDGTLYVEANLNNAEVSDGFAATEHGIFCTLPGVSDDEFLYAYRNVGNEYDFIPSNSGSAVKNLMLDYICEIQDASNITALIDYSVAYISAPDFQAHIDSAHPHPNTPNHFDDVATTQNIWATDNDNHLHKISISNLKNILRDDSAAVLSTQEQILQCRDELGLNANILMVEDFHGGDNVTDFFYSKVTSAAKNGILINIDNLDDLRTGAFYTISDGVNSEEIQIAAVTKNLSGYHCKLTKTLDFDYNPNFCYLYRSTRAGSFKRAVTWGDVYFGGVEANIERTLNLDRDFDIVGDGVFDGDFFTLA